MLLNVIKIQSYSAINKEKFVFDSSGVHVFGSKQKLLLNVIKIQSYSGSKQKLLLNVIKIQSYSAINKEKFVFDSSGVHVFGSKQKLLLNVIKIQSYSGSKQKLLLNVIKIQSYSAINKEKFVFDSSGVHVFGFKLVQICLLRTFQLKNLPIENTSTLFVGSRA